MRVSTSGEIIWQNNHGGSNYETGLSMTITQDENMVAIAGYTRSNSGSPFKYRIWGIDVNSGQVLWNKIHGGNQDDKAYGIVESFDGGFNVVGSSYSFGNERVNWMLKTDSVGNMD